MVTLFLQREAAEVSNKFWDLVTFPSCIIHVEISFERKASFLTNGDILKGKCLLLEGAYSFL